MQEWSDLSIIKSHEITEKITCRLFSLFGSRIVGILAAELATDFFYRVISGGIVHILIVCEH